MRALTLCLVGVTVLPSCTAEPLPVYGRLPEFRLAAERGQPFGSEELRGKVWVASFIFTRCPTLCPAFSAKMALVQKMSRGFGDAVHLVSFSVDPDYDTPARLAEYGSRYGADPMLWSFVTGPIDEVKSLVTDGLKIAMGKTPGVDDDVAAIFHGTYFVLLDRQAQIRGYVDSGAATAVQQVVQEEEQLLAEKP